MDSISGYLSETRRMLKLMPEKPIMQVISFLFTAWKQGKQVFVLGNGGSASTASHMANDLSKATIVPGQPRLKVIALTDNIALITAWANDNSFQEIFKEQLENLLQPGDVVIAISASGNSLNVLRALEFAGRHGAITIGWTGRCGGRLSTVADLCVCCPSDDIGMIENAHVVLDHLVTRELHRCIQTGRLAWSEDPKALADKSNGLHGSAFPLAASHRA